jgi:hypothetical protein
LPAVKALEYQAETKEWVLRGKNSNTRNKADFMKTLNRFCDTDLAENLNLQPETPEKSVNRL